MTADHSPDLCADARQRIQAVDQLAATVYDLALERTRRELATAGVDFSTAHNAMVARSYGKSWPNVNYRLLRRAMWSYNRSVDATRNAKQSIWARLGGLAYHAGWGHK